MAFKDFFKRKKEDAPSKIDNISNRGTEIIYGGTQNELDNLYKILNNPLNSAIRFNKVCVDSISTFHTCHKILAEDIGSFPIKIYRTDENGNKVILKDDYRYFMLHREPNNFTSHYDFFSTVELKRNRFGDSFVDIIFDYDGYPRSLRLVEPGSIDITKYKITDDILYYWDKRYNNWMSSMNYLHFPLISFDTIFGLDPIIPLSQNLGITYKGFQTLDNFYERGAQSMLIFESTIPEGVDAVEWSKQGVEFQAKYGGYAGTSSGGAIFPPPFTKANPIPLNLVDAQLVDTIKFHANQICSFYKISPHLVGNYESSKFNNLKELNLGYKINTLRPILRMYREELERKLLTKQEILNGYSIEFNSNAILETDEVERIKNYKERFGMGAITPNDILREEGGQTFEGGDDHYLMSNLMSVEVYNKRNQTLNSPNENTQE